MTGTISAATVSAGSGPMPSTPSQTAGPYLAIGMRWEDGPYAAAPDTPGAFWLRGRLLDGKGDAVGDGMIETWQADPRGRFNHPDDPRGPATYPGFRNFGRCLTGPGGEWGIHTLKPGRVPDGAGGLQAPHINVSIFARGLLHRVVTRVYFGDEPEANNVDDVLAALPTDEARATLQARPSADGYRLDIVLQGVNETVFFAI